MALGRRFRILWTSSAVANLADGIFVVAVALVAVKLTRSPGLVAGVALAARLPWLVLALPAGALADRLDRRQTMLWSNVVRVALLAGLAAAVGADVASIWLLYALSLGMGVAEVLFDTAAQTLMPAVVEKDDLTKANGRLFAAELVMNQFAGPPLGGFLVAVSAALALATGAGLYLVAAVALALLPGAYRSPRTGPPTSMGADIVEGVRYLTSHVVLRTLALLLGVLNLAFAAQQAMFVLYATSDTYGLGLSDAGVGLLLASMAVGAFVGSFLGDPLERWLGRTTTLSLTVVCMGVSLIVPGLTRNVSLVAAAGLLGGTATIWNVITVSLRQRIIPDHLLGRVNSAYRLVGWGSIPVGAGLGGLLGEWLGVRPVFLLAGGLSAALIVPLRLAITDGAITDAEEAASSGLAEDPELPAADPF